MKLFPQYFGSSKEEKLIKLLYAWLPPAYSNLLDSLDRNDPIGERENRLMKSIADYIKKYVDSLLEIILEITKEKGGDEASRIYVLRIPHSNYVKEKYQEFYRRVVSIEEKKLKNYIEELRQQDGNSIIIVGNEKVLGYGVNVERIRKELERNGFKVEVDDLTRKLIMERGKELSKLPELLSKAFKEMRITLPSYSSNSANEENCTVTTARVVRILKVIDEILKIHPTIK